MVGYQRRSPPPKKVLTPASPEQVALATLRAVRSIADRADDAVQLALGDAMQVAVVRALELGIPRADVQALTGYGAERIDQIAQRTGSGSRTGAI